VAEVPRPTARRAVAAARTGQVGVIGTVATISGRACDDTETAASTVAPSRVACLAFVDFGERGTVAGRWLLGMAVAYLAPPQEADIATPILGCTHYPPLTEVIGLVMGEGVTLVSSAEETEKDTDRVLTGGGLFRGLDLPPPARRIPAIGDPRSFSQTGHRFLGPAQPTGERTTPAAPASVDCASTMPGSVAPPPAGGSAATESTADAMAESAGGAAIESTGGAGTGGDATESTAGAVTEPTGGAAVEWTGGASTGGAGTGGAQAPLPLSMALGTRERNGGGDNVTRAVMTTAEAVRR
jgi:glutamate racemase